MSRFAVLTLELEEHGLVRSIKTCKICSFSITCPRDLLSATSSYAPQLALPQSQFDPINTFMPTMSSASAFLPTAPLFPAHVSQPAVIATNAITMRCRRDLKKEKSIRNQEFARAHRKRTTRRFNRRAAAEATQSEDNEFLSSIYGTIRFGAAKDNGDKGKSK